MAGCCTWKGEVGRGVDTSSAPRVDLEGGGAGRICASLLGAVLSSSSGRALPGLTWPFAGLWRLGSCLRGDLLRWLQRSHTSQAAPQPHSSGSALPSLLPPFFFAFFLPFLGSLASSFATISISSACNYELFIVPRSLSYQLSV